MGNKVQANGIKVKKSELLVGTVVFLMMLIAFTVPLRSLLYGGYSRLALILLFVFAVSFVAYITYGSRKLNAPQILWMIVFLITLRNNANLASGSTASTLYCIIAFFVPSFICKMKFEEKMLEFIMWFSMVHAIIGLFLMVFPGLLINNVDRLFPNLIFSQRSFLLATISRGYLVGLTAHYSTSGMYMAAGFIVSFSFSFYQAMKKNTGIVKMNREFWLTVFFWVCLILTGKRAHLLFGTLVFCANYVLVYNRGSFKTRSQRTFIFILMFSLLLVIVINVPAFQGTFSRFMSGEITEELYIGRVNSKWVPAMQMFKESPLFGKGWLQFGRLHPTYNSGDEIYRNVHNIYIQLLCETGIVGTVVIVGLMVYTISITIRRILVINKTRATNPELLFLIFSFAYQMFFLLYGLTGNPLYDIQTLFPYMLCCGIAYKYCTKKGIRRTNQLLERNVKRQKTSV